MEIVIHLSVHMHNGALYLFVWVDPCRVSKAGSRWPMGWFHWPLQGHILPMCGLDTVTENANTLGSHSGMHEVVPSHLSFSQ